MCCVHSPTQAAQQLGQSNCVNVRVKRGRIGDDEHCCLMSCGCRYMDNRLMNVHLVVVHNNACTSVDDLSSAFGHVYRVCLYSDIIHEHDTCRCTEESIDDCPQGPHAAAATANPYPLSKLYSISS
jgi:hypothetical protein